MKNFLKLFLLGCILLFIAACGRPGNDDAEFGGGIEWLFEPQWQFDAVFPFSGGLAAVEYFVPDEREYMQIHTLGYMNRLGEFIIPIEHQHHAAFYGYRGAPPFVDGVALIRSDYHGGVGLFDNSGNLIMPFRYDGGWGFSEGLAAVYNGVAWEYMGNERWGDTRVWGFIDPQGNEVIPLQFEAAGDFREGLAAVMRDGMWGFINPQGEVVIDFVLNPIPMEHPTTQFHHFFSEGRALVNDGAGWVYDQEKDEWLDMTLWGFIDRQGELVVPKNFNLVQGFSEGLAAVRMGNHHSDIGWGFIDLYGNWVIQPTFDNVSSFSQGRALVRYNNWLEIGFIDRNGEMIVPLGRYSDGVPFANDFAAVWQFDDTARGIGFIDRYGNEIARPIFSNRMDFSEGFAAVAMGDWEEGPEGTWINMTRWGFIDTNGDIVVPAKFHEVRSFREGLAWVRYGDLWGILQILEG